MKLNTKNDCKAYKQVINLISSKQKHKKNYENLTKKMKKLSKIPTKKREVINNKKLRNINDETYKKVLFISPCFRFDMMLSHWCFVGLDNLEAM